MQGPDVTVIVATRNRAASLSETLASLASQHTDGLCSFEVLVADNGSTDETQAVVESRAETFPVPLRTVYECRIGKPWALNTAMAAARGTVFAMLDDDTVAQPQWIKALWRCLTEEDADGVAGRVLPRWDVPRPDWLPDTVLQSGGALGLVDHGPRRLRTTDDENCRWVGGNMAVRRRAMERVGGFDVRMIRGRTRSTTAASAGTASRCAMNRRRLFIIRLEPIVSHRGTCGSGTAARATLAPISSRGSGTTWRQSCRSGGTCCSCRHFSDGFG